MKKTEKNDDLCVWLFVILVSSVVNLFSISFTPCWFV